MRALLYSDFTPPRYGLLPELTPWSRVLPEKLIVAQLIKKLAAFMELEGSLSKYLCESLIHKYEGRLKS
jgi:hypothetical protein